MVVTGRNEDRLRAALAGLAGLVGTANGHRVDAGDEDGMRRFFGDLGKADHVVVTATGAGGAGPFRDLPLADLRNGVEGKLLAHTLTAQAALEVLRPDGSLTFVTAASAGASYPGTAGLAAVNGAIEAMVPVLAVELAPLRVNAVAPGVIDTPWWGRLAPEARQAVLDSAATAAPVGRVGTADDVAEAIAYLVGNTFTSGIVLRVDGGARLRSGR